MNLKIKVAIIASLVLSSVIFATGCSEEKTPYDVNNEENYTVSVKYDAGAGIFTTNTSVIVDSYNISEMKQNGEGNAEIALLSPDNGARGNDAFKAINNGYFLAGWYSERTEITDDSGNTVYTYSGKWDFESDRLKVDPSGQYSADEPVMTLYAAWVPLFEIEFYSLDTGEYTESVTFDPTVTEELSVPAWDEETGMIEMYQFPARAGYTFNKAYYDAEGTQALDTASLEHPGTVNYETGTAENSVLKLYIDWTEGEWYRIYTVEQFLDNASVNGSYEILADLDFAGEIWPTSLMYGKFDGEIKGNGHTLKNIEFTQTNNSKVNAGLFGNLTESAKLSDITFENVKFTIKAGTRMVGTSYGLLSGTISHDATLDGVKILGSSLQIDSSCYFGVSDYSIGLVCGMGDASMVETAQIECAVVGEEPESMSVTVNDNTVTVNVVNE